MKKLVTGLAIAAACLAPLSAAKAQAFCTTGLALNFCGSVVVSTAPNGSGGTLVTIQVLNTSGGALGGNPLAVFTSIGLEGVNNAGTLSNFSVSAGGVNYTSHWELVKNESVGGGVNIDINSSTMPGSTINFGISSACSGSVDRIYSGGIGGCAPNVVTISFETTTANFAAGFNNVYIKAQGDNSSECLLGSGCTTTVPEPTSIVLVGTGLMALGSRANRWRRRNQKV